MESYVLNCDVWYFGVKIPTGAIFKKNQLSKTYQCYFNGRIQSEITLSFVGIIVFGKYLTEIKDSDILAAIEFEKRTTDLQDRIKNNRVNI